MKQPAKKKEASQKQCKMQSTTSEKLIKTLLQNNNHEKIFHEFANMIDVQVGM